MDPQLGDGDAMQRRVQLAVAHPGQAMALPGSGQARQRRSPGVHGQGRLGPEPAHASDLGDDLGRVNTPHPGRLSSRGHTRATRRPSSAWSSFARKVSSRQRVTSSPTMATWTESGRSAKRLPFEAGGEPEAEGEIEIRQLFELEEFGESPAVE
jgi:hypothetical protein